MNKAMIIVIMLLSSICVLAQDVLGTNGKIDKDFFVMGNTVIEGKTTLANATIAGVQNAHVPAGAIIMWSGPVNEIPTGWVLCDGEHYYIDGQGKNIPTPDLQGRFIVGHDPRDYDYDETGETGGEKRVTLAESQMPRYRHSGVINESGKHDHDYLEWNRIGYASGYPITDLYAYYTIFVMNINNDSIYKSGDHKHNFKTNNTGGNDSHENRPPYFVLAYIIKSKGSEEGE